MVSGSKSRFCHPSISSRLADDQIKAWGKVTSEISHPLKCRKRANSAQLLPVRCAIVWLVLVCAFPTTANPFVLFRLEVAHEHVEFDYSRLRRIVVLFVGRHVGC